jgi:hypothetical protein
MGELVPYFFQLARGARIYNGSTKPEDWLEDYSTAVNIAGGNLRWAVQYVPQMLEGPARIWLNNLPARSINGWIDFKEQFVSNFTSTYKRPNCPQQLANCRQGVNETDHDYLTRWCTLRNSARELMSSRPSCGLPMGAGMAPCYGKSFRGKCQPRWPRQSRLLKVMLWETPCSPPLIYKDRGRPRGTPAIPGDRGSSIARITGTRGEMKGRITGMEQRK